MTPQTAQRLISVQVRDEAGMVTARQRARHMASLAGFQTQDQVRIGTAVSELSRIALLRGGGAVDFSLSTELQRALSVRLVCPGMPFDPFDPALASVGRLMDTLEVRQSPASIIIAKYLPFDAPRLSPAQMAARLIQDQPSVDPQNASRDVLDLLESLRQREVELEKRHAEVQRLSVELEETNRGVVALYAELEEKAAALRAANELKGRFLRHVSHEFRTPLNSIVALANLLLRRTDGELTAEQERQVGYIRQASQDLTEMVNDLLDLAKVESGVTEVRSAPVSLGQLFRGLRGVMRPLISGDAVNLIFEEPSPDFVFETDETKLAQILRNLISNALKFTERGEVRVSYAIEDGTLCIRVADTGLGIAPADQERIFQEFTQVDNPIQGRVKGTGLGLPLSRKLAALLGGELTVSSAPGAGSTFCLTLPVHSATEVRSGEPSDTILIIDDDERARYIAVQNFRGSRYNLIEAPGGNEGAERARFERPALILLDLRMPDRSGFEVLEDLKSDPATKDIPVVIHTSRQLTTADFERLGDRHAGVLPKGEPWPAPVLDLIRTVLGEPHLFKE